MTGALREGVRLPAVLLLVFGCERGSSSLPVPGSPEYDEVVAAFYTGVAAIQVGEDERAERALSRVAELAPGEPAAAANLAIIALQQRRLEEAAELVERARSRARDDGRVRVLAALIDRERGRLDDAIGHLRRAPGAGAASPDPRGRFLLAQLLEQRGGTAAVAESRVILETLIAADSANTFLLVTAARQAARHGDGGALARALGRLEAVSVVWPEADRAQLGRVRASIASPADAGTELTMLEAALGAVPAYARPRAAIAISDQQPDVVLTEFLRLPTPSPLPPAPDLGLRFEVRPLETPVTGVLEVRPFWAGGDAPARLALLDSRALAIVDEAGGAQSIALSAPPAGPDARGAFATLDFDHDFRMDLALAGPGGLRLLRQDAAGGFAEPDAAALPPGLRTRALRGAWAADTDLDGDVDLVLAPADAPPFVLRNHGDGTFSGQALFDGVRDVRDFLWADLDDDGDPDAVFLDAAGRVHVFTNPRQDLPRFVRRDGPPAAGPARAIALGDIDADGSFELLILRGDGELVRAGMIRDGWSVRDLGRWPDLAADPVDARLLVADVDNNGALDVIASASHRAQLWLGDSAYALVPHESLPVAVTAAADLTGGGRIELLGIDAEGRPVRLAGRPARDYYSLTISPRATDQPGDRRINTFGIGGEAEVRAGLLYQKQPISSPWVHFGIGRNTGVTVARILWPNGTAQAEFDLLASQGRPIVAEQRLKGSCPWLFAFDGIGLRFVTDIAWRTALGLRISAYGSSSVIHSEDWVRIRGDQLAPREGFYELSITGELWESHFFDHVALMAVDHPAGTEVFVDERFFLPPPELKVHATAPLSPVAGAWDDGGRDLTAIVGARDERYVSTFELGDYQGVARGEHFLEIDLGHDAPADAPLLLVAHGWVLPTDGSINFALGQGRHAPPRGLSAEVPDGRGGWTVLHADLGMPAGKTKTVLIDLAGAFREGAPKRVRLRTNMEIYWDHVAWTVALPDAELRIVRLAPHEADLRYRGFSRTRQAGRRAPELPDYEVAGTAPLWRDLEGYHTRFGDVRPLLHEVDDRYVIMNAGDEMRLRFAVPGGPRPGEVRDFVLVSDAWVKDGDYNNGFSGTLLPLPYHGLTDYSRAPGRLQDDPAFRRHPDDWREYHTRYVTATRFRHVLSRR